MGMIEVASQITAYDKLIKKAVLLCMARISDQDFVRLKITQTGHVRVSWPELDGDYYDSSYSIETQTEDIEPALFVKTVEEIEAMQAEEERKRAAIEEVKQQRYRDLQWELDRNNERAERILLAKLKKKYEGT